MNRVAVIDTGMSNLDSAVRAIQEVGASPYVVTDPTAMAEPDHIVLPGVGSFDEASAALWSSGMADAITEQVNAFEVPVLGICLGMQLLATTGSEGGSNPGLGLVPGSVVRLDPPSDDVRLPHMGWNEVDPTRSDHPLFAGIETSTDFYFVHSFHFVTDEAVSIVATTPYCGGFTSVVSNGSAFGVQFHPEKSHRSGLRLLRNFVGL